MALGEQGHQSLTHSADVLLCLWGPGPAGDSLLYLLPSPQEGAWGLHGRAGQVLGGRQLHGLGTPSQVLLQQVPKTAPSVAQALLGIGLNLHEENTEMRTPGSPGHEEGKVRSREAVPDSAGLPQGRDGAQHPEPCLQDGPGWGRRPVRQVREALLPTPASLPSSAHPSGTTAHPSPSAATA